MNFKSGILKLSIIIMLVLVLIPLASAMDSNDTFYEEYDCPDVEEVIIEHDSVETDDAPVEVSLDEEDDSFSEFDNKKDSDQISESVAEDNKDTVVVTEFEVDSVRDVPHESYYEEENAEENLIVSSHADEIQNDSNEVSFDEQTLNEISVDVQGLVYILKENIQDYISVHNVSCNSCTKNTKNSFKILELKNIFLITNFDYDNSDNILNSAVVVYVNKLNSDYAYSIDNSIVGDKNAIVILQSNFLNFYPCFDAIFCGEFFDVDYFFAEYAVGYIFSDFDVEYSFFENYQYIRYCQIIIV